MSFYFVLRRIAPVVGFIAALTVNSLLAAPLVAQSSGSLSGRVVTAANEPVVGAFVSIDSAPPATQTDASGSFRIDGIVSGPHIVHIRRSGYTEAAYSVEVASDQVARLDLVLAPSIATLREVTVIGSKTDLAETRERLNQIPGSVAMVDGAQIRATRQANLKDVLQFVPGVYVQPRFGAADESQISIRGSGLRNNFHARGVNLLVNGMPYRNADGFTDFESLELLTTEAIEVYKGGNALRYGGSTLGGAINLDTKTGHSASPVSLFAQGGSFGFYKTQLESGNSRGNSNYYASYARTSVDGYRQWSAQQRDRVNLHGGYRFSPNTDARLFYFFAHVKEHLPGALTPRRLRGRSPRGGPGKRRQPVGARLRPTSRRSTAPDADLADPTSRDQPLYAVPGHRSPDL